MESAADLITLGLIWYVVFLFSTTCHEGAHALVAKWGGDPTASEQITLNPLPHIQRSPVGMVLVPMLILLSSQGSMMMGWASAPYDPVWAHQYPHRAARMALAGPAANFTLMLSAGVAIRVGVALELFRPPETISTIPVTEAVEPTGIGSLLATVLSVLFVLNLILGTFNLLPVPPLDGHAGITILMSEDRARWFLDLFRQPGFALMGIVVAWMLFGRIFDTFFTIALNVLYFPLVTYG